MRGSNPCRASYDSLSNNQRLIRLWFRTRTQASWSPQRQLTEETLFRSAGPLTLVCILAIPFKVHKVQQVVTFLLELASNTCDCSLYVRTVTTESMILKTNSRLCQTCCCLPMPDSRPCLQGGMERDESTRGASSAGDGSTPTHEGEVSLCMLEDMSSMQVVTFLLEVLAALCSQVLLQCFHVKTVSLTSLGQMSSALLLIQCHLYSDTCEI